MRVKKFEAPTLQEALDSVKRELGPEAIILHTKKNKGGFGLLSKSSVEVTAAVSDRALNRKTTVDKSLPDEKRAKLQSQSAPQQARTYEKFAERNHLDDEILKTSDRVSLTSRSARPTAPQAQTARPQAQVQGPPQARVQARAQTAPASAASTTNRPMTAVRYADIDDDARPSAPSVRRAAQAAAQNLGGSAQPAYSPGGMGVEDEVRQLKRMVSELRAAQEDVSSGSGASLPVISSPALKDALEQLILNGVDKRYAIPLIKKVAFEMGDARLQDSDQVLDQVAIEIMTSSSVMSALSGIEPRTKIADQSGIVSGTPGARVLALVGPTGVGKTTTLAKIASEAILKRSLKVGLINLDTYKVSAFDQLATYAKILNAPFRSAGSVEDLKLAIEDFKNLDLVLVDTAGRSQRDPGALKEMEQLLHTIPNIQTHLVLSATTRDAELYDMANRFSLFRPQGLVFSKLDEATTYGALFNLQQKTKLPLMYFTTGQRVPEDIEESTRERIVSLIMDI